MTAPDDPARWVATARVVMIPGSGPTSSIDETAELLGISVRTLRNKINQYRTEGVHVPSAS